MTKPEQCPLCETPWKALNERYRCDHEAGWYREWLGLAVDAMSDSAKAKFAAALAQSVP